MFVDDLSSNATGLLSSNSGHASGTSLGDDEEDWDHIQTTSDHNHAARSFEFSSDVTATVRGGEGKSPYLSGQVRASDADTARRPREASLSLIFALGCESPKTPLFAIPPSILENYTRSIKLSDVHEADAAVEAAVARQGEELHGLGALCAAAAEGNPIPRLSLGPLPLRDS